MATLLTHSVFNIAKLKRLVMRGLSAATVVLPLVLSSCGYHLRGYDTQMTYAVGSTVLSIDDDAVSFRLKQPLKKRLNSVGIRVVDDIGREINSNNQLYTGTIRVDNIRFKRYELVGVLTEVRLVLSADVVYQTLSNDESDFGKPITVKNKIQVERSYQFDEASVSIEDKQGQQIQDWLYDGLSQRIVDQYVALSLPRVSPNTSDSNSIKHNPIKSEIIAPANIPKLTSGSDTYINSENYTNKIEPQSRTNEHNE